MWALDFFISHPVFTVDEFRAASRATSRQTTLNLLRYHIEQRHIVRLRRGLYATPQAAMDPYLIAAKLAPDAVLAYHSALQFRGRAYSIWHRYPVLTRRREAPLELADMELVPVQAPLKLRERDDLGGHIVNERHGGVTTTVRVTTYERTLVDVLDRPDLGGGWEEIWRSLDMIEFFDLEAILDYTSTLGVALTAARVGYYLERNRERLMVEEHHLQRIEDLRPQQPRYFDPRLRGGSLSTRWNLYVPPEIEDQTWEELQ